MCRRPFSYLSALSLLLCVAVVALWVRSYWRSEILRYCDSWAKEPTYTADV